MLKVVKNPTRTWSKSDRKMIRTWQVSLYKQNIFRSLGPECSVFRHANATPLLLPFPFSLDFYWHVHIPTTHTYLNSWSIIVSVASWYNCMPRLKSSIQFLDSELKIRQNLQFTCDDAVDSQFRKSSLLSIWKRNAAKIFFQFKIFEILSELQEFRIGEGFLIYFFKW